MVKSSVLLQYLKYIALGKEIVKVYWLIDTVYKFTWLLCGSLMVTFKKYPIYFPFKLPNKFKVSDLWR